MSQGTVTGVITCRQPILLPFNATIAIRLQDVSLADAEAIDLATESFITAGQQVPIPFGLDYDPAKINSQHTYALQVRIMVDDQLRFLNMMAYPVITRGHPTTVEIVVDPVS